MSIGNKDNAKTIEINSGSKTSIGVVLEGEDKGVVFSKTIKDGKVVVTHFNKVSSFKSVRHFDGIYLEEYEQKYFK